jgi:hypothetical protein
MQDKLKDIHELDHVLGCLLINNDGAIVHAFFSSPQTTAPEGHDWAFFVKALGDVQEVEIIFDDMRMYIRKTKTGYLLILAEIYAMLSLIRLHCDVVMPKLDQHKPKGLKRFLKK